MFLSILRFFRAFSTASPVPTVSVISGDPIQGMLSSIDIVQRFLQSAPVDLFGMVAALGGHVAYQDFSDSPIAGRIESKNGAFHFLLPSKAFLQRQRCILARLVAHTLLHPHLVGAALTDTYVLFWSSDFVSGLGADVDAEVDAYATTLVAPPNLVRKLWNSGVRTPKALAKSLDLTEGAVHIRAHSLGLKLAPS